MDFLGKFKLLWFLSLCLLSEARHIHRREVESSSESVGDLKALRSPQKYIIEPVQTLTKVSDNAVAPPYDTVDFGYNDKLNEIESKNEKDNHELIKALDLQSSEGYNDKSTQTEKEFEIEIESSQLKETLNEEIVNQSNIELKNIENTAEIDSKTASQETDNNLQSNQNNLIKVVINEETENKEHNLQHLRNLANSDDELINSTVTNILHNKAAESNLEQKTPSDENIVKDKENSEQITQIIADKTNDHENKTLNSEIMKPLTMNTEKEQVNHVKEHNSSDNGKETFNSESTTSVKVKEEKQTLNSEHNIPTQDNNLKEEVQETLDSERPTTVRVETEDKEIELVNSENVKPTKENNTNNKEKNPDDKDKESKSDQIEKKEKVKETMISEKIEESTTTAPATTNTFDSENVTHDLNEISLQNINKETMSNKVTLEEKPNPLDNFEKVNKGDEKMAEYNSTILTTEEIKIEITSIESNLNSSKDSIHQQNISTEATTTESKETTGTTTTETPTNAIQDLMKQPNVTVTIETTTSDIKDSQNNQTSPESVQEISTFLAINQTTTETTIQSKTTTEKIPVNISTAIQPGLTNKPSSQVTTVTTITTTIKPITYSPIEPTTKPSVSFITQRPTRPIRLPTRRPTPTRRPRPTRRPSTTQRPSGWFPNFPVLPNAPLLPTFFINPFNTTTSTANQTQSTFGFGLFAVPWNWRPNFGNFFSPNRIIETRPPLDDIPTPPAESRDLAFWNALFHRGLKKDPGANKKPEDNPDEDELKPEEAIPTFWKPWHFITGTKLIKNTEQATIPANTQVLHLYFPLKYPFQGQIVQTPGKKFNDEVLKPIVEDKKKAVPKAGKAVIEVQDPVKIVEKEASSDLVNEVLEEESGKTKSDDDKNVHFTVKGNRKGSLMFEVELPKPMVNFVKGVMDTFRPQQN